jgi:hypothetical protein
MARKLPKARTATPMPPVKPPRRGGSVAIVAMGPSHRSYTGLASIYGDRARLADEVWAINAMGTVIQHDLLFHMDDCKVQEARAKADPDGNVAGMVKWLRGHPKFITSRVYDDYPGALAYPLQEVVDAFGHAYFNSTVAYAMAYALHKGFSRIELYGCDYSYPDAHRAEKGRACLEFWIGLAVARGIQVVIAADSTLMDSNAPLCERLYGYDAYNLQLVYKEGRAAPIVDWCLREKLPSVDEIERRYRNEKVQ